MCKYMEIHVKSGLNKIHPHNEFLMIDDKSGDTLAEHWVWGPLRQISAGAPHN